MEPDAVSLSGTEPGDWSEPDRVGEGRRRGAALLLYLCFFLSGAAGLAYEVAWLRSLELVFGGTSYAAATVLAAFMAGLALGSYAFGRKVGGWIRPLRVYAWLEIAIGLYALLVPLILAGMGPLYGALWSVLGWSPFLFGTARFVVCFAVLIPATLFMGATLPVIAQHWSRWEGSLVGGVGRLYGINTLGAVVGVVVTGFVLLPVLGFSTTVAAAVMLNLSVAAAAFFLSARLEGAPAPIAEEAGEAPEGVAAPTALPAEPTTSAAPTRDRASPEERNTLVALAFTGFAAMALEVAWTRTLTLVVGPSVYAFSIMLATFLVGLGLGSVLFSWVLGKSDKDRGLFWILATASGLLSILSLGLASELPYLFAYLFTRWEANNSVGLMFGIEALVCGAAIFLPTLAMGGLFPAALAESGLERWSTARGAARATAARAGGGVGGGVGASVGRLYAGNTVGAVFGAFAGGFLLIPTLGISGTIHGAAFVYLAVGATFQADPRKRSLRPALGRAIAVTITGLLTVAMIPDWNPRIMTSGIYEYVNPSDQDFTREEFRETAQHSWELLYYKDGPVSTVTVVMEPDVLRPLGDEEIPNVVYLTDGKADASSVGDMHTQVMMAHAPLLLHPAPERALVIGLASGTTAGSVLTHPVRTLDIVEIEPAAEMAAHLFDFVNGRPLDDPRTTLTFADARSFLRGTAEAYDVIISEPSNPWMAGPANLFTREFFEIGSRALREGGLFTQWIHTYSLDPELLRSVIATFQSVFPEVYVFHPLRQSDLILVGSSEPIEMDVPRMGGEWLQQAVREDISRIGIRDLASVLAQARIGPEEVNTLVEGARINTDDNGMLLFGAPLNAHSFTLWDNDQLLEGASRGVAKYLLFPGETSEVEVTFLGYLAIGYQAFGFVSEAAGAQLVRERRLELAPEGGGI